METSKLSGLEMLQKVVAGDVSMASMAVTMPMEMVEIAEGVVRFKVRANENHLTPLGLVHGGFASTVLQSVTGCAVHSLLEAGEHYELVDLSVKMIKEVPAGVDLCAEGKIINISRQLAVSEAAIRDDSGNIFAHATASGVIKRFDA